MVRSVKRAKREACFCCGRLLVELPWGKSGSQRLYILTCDNAECACYRNPVMVFTGQNK